MQTFEFATYLSSLPHGKKKKEIPRPEKCSKINCPKIFQLVNLFLSVKNKKEREEISRNSTLKLLLK